MTNPQAAEISAMIDENWPKLRRFFQTKVPPSDALDLAQATVTAFLEGRDRMTGSPRAYLWGIARIQVLKYYERHRPGAQFDSATHTALDVGPTFSSRLDQRTQLLRALHSLPLDQQIAIEQRYGEGLSLEEVAAALGVSLATAKRYLAAAETTLREQLPLETFEGAYRRM